MPLLSADRWTKDAAVQLVDDREAEARRRFEHLKARNGRAQRDAPIWPRRDSGEA